MGSFGEAGRKWQASEHGQNGGIFKVTLFETSTFRPPLKSHPGANAKLLPKDHGALRTPRGRFSAPRGQASGGEGVICGLVVVTPPFSAKQERFLPVPPHPQRCRIGCGSQKCRHP